MHFLSLLVSVDKVFKFQPAACNGCHDVLIMSIDFNIITILNIDGIDYRCIIAGISKSEAINLLRNAYLSEKSGSFSL